VRKQCFERRARRVDRERRAVDLHPFPEAGHRNL
jgi:hypothetical protein